MKQLVRLVDGQLSVQYFLCSATKETRWGKGSKLAHLIGGDKRIKRESWQVDLGPHVVLFSASVDH